MMSPETLRKVQELVEAVIQGNATPEQWRELSLLFCQDKAIIEEYLRQMDTHLDLLLLLRQDAPARECPVVRRGKSRWKWAALAAASVALLAGGGAVFSLKDNAAAEKRVAAAEAAVRQNSAASTKKELSWNDLQSEMQPRKNAARTVETAKAEPQAIPSAREPAETKEEGETMKKNSATKTAMGVAASAMVLSVAPMAASGESAGAIAVTAFPEQSVYWHSLPERNVSVPVYWPEQATTATLTIQGMTSKSTTQLEKTAPSQLVTLQFGAPDHSRMSSDVISLTLAFNDGTVRTARLGNVGGVNGGALRLIPAGKDSKDWHKVEYSAVLAVDKGDTQISLDNAVKMLDGAAGWYSWTPIAQGAHTVARGDTSVDLQRVAHGTVVILR